MPAPQRVPFAAPFIGPEEYAAVARVLDSGWIGTGAETEAAEGEFARYLGLAHTLLVNSGTAALHLALAALGVGPGDEVIVPAITFTATAATVVHAGARPVFTDVDAVTLNIDVAAAEAAITPRTRAIVAVHMAGRMADVRAVRDLCDARGLVMIEDSAHALPAWRDGHTPGELADAAAFSFFVTKPLTSAEGGLLAARSARVLQAAQTLSRHGIQRNATERHHFGGSPHYDVVAAGFKYNMPDLVSAVLRCQLQRAGWMHARRREIAAAYLAGLAGLPGLELPPADQPADRSSWYLFVIRVPPGTDRDGFAGALARAGVGTSVHLRPLHQFSYYAREFPADPSRVQAADSVYPRLLSLPIYPAMPEEAVGHVIEAVRNAVRETSR